MGQKFEGGEQRILWENTFKKEIENQSTCSPCRYVGTAEFSFFPKWEERTPGFGPARKLHCVTSGGLGLCYSTH